MTKQVFLRKTLRWSLGLSTITCINIGTAQLGCMAELNDRSASPRRLFRIYRYSGYYSIFQKWHNIKKYRFQRIWDQRVWRLVKVGGLGGR